MKEIERRASGKIIVFNNYSTNSQRLIARTRFETLEGKIYRIRDAVVVPGISDKDGRKTPGSIEVTVFADEPGEEYNIGYTDFTKNNGWPNSTGSPFSTKISTTCPPISALISFISFIASMMHTTSPG